MKEILRQLCDKIHNIANEKVYYEYREGIRMESGYITFDLIIVEVNKVSKEVTSIVFRKQTSVTSQMELFSNVNIIEIARTELLADMLQYAVLSSLTNKKKYDDTQRDKQSKVD